MLWIVEFIIKCLDKVEIIDCVELEFFCEYEYIVNIVNDFELIIIVINII